MHVGIICRHRSHIPIWTLYDQFEVIKRFKMKSTIIISYCTHWPIWTFSGFSFSLQSLSVRLFLYLFVVNNCFQHTFKREERLFHVPTCYHDFVLYQSTCACGLIFIHMSSTVKSASRRHVTHSFNMRSNPDTYSLNTDHYIATWWLLMQWRLGFFSTLGE